MQTRECARLESLDGEPVNLLGVKLSGDLRGLLLEASVEQRFCNPGDTNIELVYSFPLPWGAVLLGVDVVLGGRHLTGAVVEKKQAEIRYEEALSEGNAAIMLERNRDHSYSLNLGNLAAGEHCTVTLRYAQTLQFEQRGLRVLIPTVIAPRYGDAVRNGGLAPHQAPSHSLLVDHPFMLELRLHGELAQARIASPSHPVSVVQGQAEAHSVLKVSLARQASLDRDFVLVVDQLANASMAVAAPDSVLPGAVAVLASFCPRIATQEKAATAVKILVDCSGSMRGDSIAAARRALQAIVQQLDAGDKFSLSRFGSMVEHRARGLWKTTETTRLAAQRWVGALEANLGGTEIEAALASTFAIAQSASSDILLVTDGQISAIDSTVSSARASGHRLFIVGIGSSSAETHLRRLAEATGGACDFVAPGEAVEPAILRMFARLRSPRLTDLRVEWPPGVAPQWVSPLSSSVFDGDTVHVFALLEHPAAGHMRLFGRRASDGVAQEIGGAALTGALESADTLPRMAAYLRLHSLSADDRSKASSDAAALAVAYQLVSDETNFLLVHERADGQKAVEMPALQKVEQMVPAGWGGMGVVRFCRSHAGDASLAGIATSSELPAQPSIRRTSARRVRPLVLDDVDGMSLQRCDADDMDDRPDWLRKREQTINCRDPRFWARSEHYEGLTPLGVSEWLRLTPAVHWPTTYADLRQIGLGAAVLDWLELVLAPHGKAYAEGAVVHAFICVMSLQATYDALAKSGTLRGAAQLSVLRTSDVPAGVDEGLVQAMLASLNGLATGAWPDRVFELG